MSDTASPEGGVSQYVWVIFVYAWPIPAFILCSLIAGYLASGHFDIEAHKEFIESAIFWASFLLYPVMAHSAGILGFILRSIRKEWNAGYYHQVIFLPFMFFIGSLTFSKFMSEAFFITSRDPTALDGIHFFLVILWIIPVAIGNMMLFSIIPTAIWFLFLALDEDRWNET